MEIEERGGADPERLAAAILRQLAHMKGAVPGREIALALDIVEIREEPLNHLEGALVTSAERNVGSILVNRRSNAQRRRYSIGHELLHFLNPRHKQTSASGFECSAADMAAGGMVDRPGVSAHLRQEIEANRFAIELLAPHSRMAPFLRGAADLEHVLRAADKLDLSKQAAARRYV
jgi:Zn-dependent peptidase ImmA (M78 family)